jgi:hypothetical protein
LEWRDAIVAALAVRQFRKYLGKIGDKYGVRRGSFAEHDSYKIQSVDPKLSDNLKRNKCPEGCWMGGTK